MKPIPLFLIGALVGAGIADITQGIFYTPEVVAIPKTFSSNQEQRQFIPLAQRISWCKYRTNCTTLAKAIVYEARSEPIVGQYAVAHVILNRVEHKRFPNTIESVLKQHKQFSYQQDHWKQKKPSHKDWDKAFSVAFDVLNKKVDDPTGGALFYHTKVVKPYWASSMDYAMTIESHHFYK